MRPQGGRLSGRDAPGARGGAPAPAWVGPVGARNARGTEHDRLAISKCLGNASGAEIGSNQPDSRASHGA
jgi:hypothetical protein